MTVLNGINLIQMIAASVSTFHGIGIRHFKMSIEYDPSGSFFCHILVFIFGVHVVFTEWTV